MTIRDAITQIISQAEEQKLPYLLVGGHAVNLYGITRFTRDVDLLIPDSHIEPWTRFLTDSFKYRLFQSTHSFLRFENDSQDFLAVDFMLVASDTWGKLLSKAESRSLSSGQTVQLPHPTHLIALKIFAVSSPYRRKDNIDWSDIINLIQEQKLSLDDPQFQGIILKYGGKEMLQKLREALS